MKFPQHTENFHKQNKTNRLRNNQVFSHCILCLMEEITPIFILLIWTIHLFSENVIPALFSFPQFVLMIKEADQNISLAQAENDLFIYWIKFSFREVCSSSGD